MSPAMRTGRVHRGTRTADTCSAVVWGSTWYRTHLEGVQRDEDVGPNDAEVDKDPAHPGQPQHGQQHQDGLGRGPVRKKISGLPGHVAKLRHCALAPTP